LQIDVLVIALPLDDNHSTRFFSVSVKAILVSVSADLQISFAKKDL
jgi:hypothetical protein